MILPDQTDVGRKVVYSPRGVIGRQEEGVITSYNDHCVFVRYGSDTGSKGTAREDLDWAVKGENDDD